MPKRINHDRQDPKIDNPLPHHENDKDVRHRRKGRRLFSYVDDSAIVDVFLIVSLTITLLKVLFIEIRL
jgi:hypothetical protein